MKWLLVFPLALTACGAVPQPDGVPEPGRVVFEVSKPRQCPQLPTLADNATTAERTAFTRTVVLMYAQCAKGE